MGRDGDNTGSNRLFARDAIGFTMGYHSNDYEAISWAGTGSSTWFEAQNAWSATQKAGMWNGNISLIAQGIGSTNATTSAFEVVGGASRLYAYQYDQLNRLLEAKAWQGESGNSWAGATSTTAHHNTWTYDAAGNILTQMRNKQDGDTLDNLTYHYGTGLKRNQLGYIDDAITTTPPAVTGELEDQAAGNYVYDAIGNLIADVRDSIGTASVPGIEWDVRGKITKVTKVKNGQTIVIEYAYDALGQRIRKTVKNGLNENTWTHTYYVRDAQGNALAVYSSALVQSGSQYTATLKVQEYTLYGASRLGTHAIDLTVSTRVWTGGSYNATTGAYSRPGTPVSTGPSNFPQSGYISLVRGQKRYELSNHLGNVLAVVSDRKLQITATWSTAKVYAPDVLSYTDYYAFGWEMPGRSSGSYRYGFNGQEEETEFWGGAISFEYRVQDPRSGRFFSVDPIAAQYPWYTPYQVAGNMMIMARELEGLEPYGVITGDDGKRYPANSTATVTITPADGPGEQQSSGSATASLPQSSYRNWTPYNPAPGATTRKADPNAGGTIRDGDAVRRQQQKMLDPFLHGGPGHGEGAGKAAQEAVMWVGGELAAAKLVQGVQVLRAATKSSESVVLLKSADEVAAAVEASSQGGLNLFRWGAPQTAKSIGWKEGDYMLYLPNKGTPPLNWKANYGALRREMKLGKPIFDSYKSGSGQLIESKIWDPIKEKYLGEFLNAERYILKSRSWIYNPSSGAWMPPGF